MTIEKFEAAKEVGLTLEQLEQLEQMEAEKFEAAKEVGLTLEQLEQMEALGYVFQNVKTGYARHDFGGKPEPYKLIEVLGQDTGLAKAEISVAVFGLDGFAFRDAIIGGSKRNLFAVIDGEKVAIKFDNKEGLFFEVAKKAA